MTAGERRFEQAIDRAIIAEVLPQGCVRVEVAAGVGTGDVKED